MKLGTLLAASATCMVATGVAVWTLVPPAHGNPIASEPSAPTPKPAPPPPVDHSHFSAGKTLMVDARLGHKTLPANIDGETLMLVDVSAADTAAKSPAPLDLAIVIDRSGSMAGKRMTNALAAARTAVERLRDGDVVSVISFDTQVTVVVPPMRIDATSRKDALAKIGTIHVGGDTCISCGIDSAMQQLAQHTGMVDRILLLSDGEPTAGVKDLDGFRRIAENCRRMNAPVTTIGVDVQYDERVMSELARSSNGHHFFVGDPSGLPAIFDQEMIALTKTVANEAELTVDLAPGASVEQVFDRESTIRGSHVVVPLGSFSAGEHKTVLARVKLSKGAAGERAIASVHLHYDDLAESKHGECEGLLATRLTNDVNDLVPLDGVVSARETASETKTALEQANELVREGKVGDANGVIARQQQLVRARHEAALAAAPAPMRADVDRAFDKDTASLGSANAAFDEKQPEPAKVQAQMRKNQATVINATE